MGIRLPAQPAATAVPPAPSGWVLDWYDELDGPTLDHDKWVEETGDPKYGNDETQFYTARPDNLRIYKGTEHPHEAQSPEVLDIAGMNRKNKVGA